MISTEHVACIGRLLDENGIPAQRYLERARISPAVCEGKVEFLPGRSVWALAEAADEGEALGDFWLDMARASDWRKSAWAQHLTHAATLGDALRAMCSSYVRQIPMNQLGLTANEEFAWFWRRRTCDVREWPGSEPAEQYTLSFMLAVIRAAAPDWLPERLRVECAQSGWAGRTQSLPDVCVEFDQPVLAIQIPKAMLALPVSISRVPPEARESEAPAKDFQGSLRQVLQLRFRNGLPSQDEAADMLWTSPRTLRRRLAAGGGGHLLASRSGRREIRSRGDAPYAVPIFRTRNRPGARLLGHRTFHPLLPAPHGCDPRRLSSGNRVRKRSHQTPEALSPSYREEPICFIWSGAPYGR